MVEFGKNLETVREIRGITKTEMARMLDLSLPAYSLYEKGEREPKLSNLKRIADILDVTVDELLKEEGNNSDFERAKRIWQQKGYTITEIENNRITITPPNDDENKSKFTLFKDNFMRLTNKTRKKVAKFFTPSKDRTFCVLANVYLLEYAFREESEREFKKLFPNTKYPLPLLNEESARYEENI